MRNMSAFIPQSATQRMALASCDERAYSSACLYHIGLSVSVRLDHCANCQNFDNLAFTMLDAIFFFASICSFQTRTFWPTVYVRGLFSKWIASEGVSSSSLRLMSVIICLTVFCESIDDFSTSVLSEGMPVMHLPLNNELGVQM